MAERISMTRPLGLALVFASLLSACGIDGEPVQPTLDARVGVGSSGVNVRGGIGVSNGPLSVYVGF